MKYGRVGELSVSKLVFGADKAGTSTPKDEFFAMADKYLYNGGNCLDSARVYCGGASETVVGEWMKKRGNRNHVLIATKGCHPDPVNMAQPRMSKADMRFDIETSLRELGTDYIDLYWLHRDATSLEVGEIIENLNDFIKEGKIREIACSNWFTDRIEAANRYAKDKGLKPFVASQIKWSLAKSCEDIYTGALMVEMSDAEYEKYKEAEFPVFAYSSQAQGLFMRVIKGGYESLDERMRVRFDSAQNRERINRVKTEAARLGVSPTACVLSYITCNSVPGFAIIGCRTTEQLEDSLTAADFTITKDEADALFKVY